MKYNIQPKRRGNKIQYKNIQGVNVVYQTRLVASARVGNAQHKRSFLPAVLISV